MTDLDSITRAEAARFMNMSAAGLWKRLARNEELRDAIVVNLGTFTTARISLPRLCRYMHGAESESLIPEWHERVASWRSESQVAS